nr:unnamed protein product [Callosobruchus analis]
MERSPVISWLFHTRVLSLLLLLGALDLHFVQHAYLSTVAKGASVQLVFGFEYAVLLTVVINIIIKYALHSVDLNSETPWDNKAVFLLYTELVMGLIKVILYVAFVAIMVRIYTLPLFAFRPMYYTIRNFKKAFSDVILSRRAIHNMNTLYPDATPEELAAADNVCIICREEMLTASKKLPCNHIFHTSCLRSWFQRQQTCPTCRLNILRNPTNNNNTRNPPPAAAAAAPPPGERLGGAPAPNPFMFQNLPAAAAAAAAAGAAVPPPDAQQQRPAHAGATASGPSSSAAPSSTSAAPGSSFAFPPPPFPFVPFMPPPPPPMPPQHLARLSAEELRRMEGNERENVEARIQCLRNIQMLLDAAVMMMQQYSSTVVMSQQMAQPTPSSSIPSNPGTSNGTLHGGIWDNTSSSAESPKIAKVAPTTSSSPPPSQVTAFSSL